MSLKKGAGKEALHAHMEKHESAKQLEEPEVVAAKEETGAAVADETVEQTA